MARDFPNLTLVAFHMGYPYCDDLNMVAMGHPNVHLCLSLLVPWAISAPYKFAKILGEALRFVGPDRIIWGTDSAGYGAQIGAAVIGLADFQIPEELQWQYGYLPLTDGDKRKIFGGNLGRLLGIDTSRRRGGQGAVLDSLNPKIRPPVTLAKPLAPAADTAPSGLDPASPQAATDGHFDVLLATPMGELPGTVSLVIAGSDLSGNLVLLGKSNPFRHGTIDGQGNTAFQGELQTPLGTMHYSVTGSLRQGKIQAIAKTKLGDLRISSR